MTWHFANYSDALREYWPQFLRSLLLRRRSPPSLCLLLGYPLAYAIAFKAGRWKNLLLVLVIAPFFTSFLIRTLAWKTILADDGPVVVLTRCSRRQHLLGCPTAGCWPRRSRWSPG